MDSCVSLLRLEVTFMSLGTGDRPGASVEGSLSGTSVSGGSVSWTFGAKLPLGCQLPDGSVIPEGAEPQPDGFVLIPGRGEVPATNVTMPDGIQLSAILKETGEAPTPAPTMPDGTEPAVMWGWAGEYSFGWPQFPKPSMSGGSFTWKFGAKLPLGCQLPDGSFIGEGAEPQPDGFVLIPGGRKVPASDVTLPDGILLSALLNATGEAPTPAPTMPDGSKPAAMWSWYTSGGAPGALLAGIIAGASEALASASGMTPKAPGSKDISRGAPSRTSGSLKKGVSGAAASSSENVLCLPVIQSSDANSRARMPASDKGSVMNSMTTSMLCTGASSVNGSGFASSGFSGGGMTWTQSSRPCLLYTSPSPRDRTRSRMPSSA